MSVYRPISKAQHARLKNIADNALAALAEPTDEFGIDAPSIDEIMDRLVALSAVINYRAFLLGQIVGRAENGRNHIDTIS